MASNDRTQNLAKETGGSTQSLCPVCLQRIEARRVEKNGEIWLRKQCPEHGEFAAPIWRGPPHWDTWLRPKSPSPATGSRRPIVNGCPFDCGLCANHRQRSCTVLIEVTQRCNLGCPICFAASSGQGPADPPLAELGQRFENIARLSPGSNIQLSGGEPTLRDDLPQIVALGKKSGFHFIQINTNGIRPALDAGYLKDLAAAGLDSLFLQFDGTEAAIYETLRGRALLDIKRQAVDACGKNGVAVVLVVTVKPGVNDHNLGAILEMATAWTPVVRGVHFQPISYFGRYPDLPGPRDRITLPELMRAIDIQTRGAFPMNRFNPPGCENAMCSFSGKFLIQENGSVLPLLPVWQGCCGPPQPANTGALRAISQTARQWSPVPGDASSLRPDVLTHHPTAEAEASEAPMDLDRFIHLARNRTLAVSAMAFQDAWNVDLERVRDCCIHVADARGRLIPFCLYNLTGLSGRGLYRP